jgi:hypothetical protein
MDCDKYVRNDVILFLKWKRTSLVPLTEELIAKRLSDHLRSQAECTIYTLKNYFRFQKFKNSLKVKEKKISGKNYGDSGFYQVL